MAPHRFPDLLPSETRSESSPRLSIPLTLAISITVSLCAAWGSASVSSARNEDTRKDVAEMKAQQTPQAVKMQQVDDRLGEVERNQKKTNDALERIETKLGTR